MTFASSQRANRTFAAVRLGALVPIALLLAHDVSFAVHYGIGAEMNEAMSEGGHDVWWTPFMLGVLAIAAGLAVGAAYRLGRLSGIAASGRAAYASRLDGPSYSAELGRMWRVLFPAVALCLLVQENLEHVASQGHLAGLEPLAGLSGIPLVAVVTLAVAAVGALVRWRIGTLEARIAAARSDPWRRPRTIGVPARARLVAALLAHRWRLARHDVGRAPPTLLGA